MSKTTSPRRSPRPVPATSKAPKTAPQPNPETEFKKVLIPLDVYQYAVVTAMIEGMDVGDWIVRGILDSARCIFDDEATRLEQRLRRSDEDDQQDGDAAHQ